MIFKKKLFTIQFWRLGSNYPADTLERFARALIINRIKFETFTEFHFNMSQRIRNSYAPET